MKPTCVEDGILSSSVHMWKVLLVKFECGMYIEERISYKGMII